MTAAFLIITLIVMLGLAHLGYFKADVTNLKQDLRDAKQAVREDLDALKGRSK